MLKKMRSFFIFIITDYSKLKNISYKTTFSPFPKTTFPPLAKILEHKIRQWWFSNNKIEFCVSLILYISKSQ